MNGTGTFWQKIKRLVNRATINVSVSTQVIVPPPAIGFSPSTSARSTTRPFEKRLNNDHRGNRRLRKPSSPGERYAVLTEWLLHPDPLRLQDDWEHMGRCYQSDYQLFQEEIIRFVREHGVRQISTRFIGSQRGNHHRGNPCSDEIGNRE